MAEKDITTIPNPFAGHDGHTIIIRPNTRGVIADCSCGQESYRKVSFGGPWHAVSEADYFWTWYDQAAANQEAAKIAAEIAALDAARGGH